MDWDPLMLEPCAVKVASTVLRRGDGCEAVFLSDDIGSENFKGDLSKKKYTIIANTTSSTASRDIAELLKKECIEQVEGTSGRSVRYRVKV